MSLLNQKCVRGEAGILCGSDRCREAGGDSCRPLAALTAGLGGRRAGNARAEAPHLGALRSGWGFLAVGALPGCLAATPAPPTDQ